MNSPRPRRIRLLLIGLILCGAPAGAFPPPVYTRGDYLFVLESEYDYAAGMFSLMDAHPGWEHDDCLESICGDATARCAEGLIYVVNRMGCDNIQVIDPAAGFETITQFSTGAGSNPQDICVLGPHRAFVSRYETTELWEVDPSNGLHTDTISLSPLADHDGLPEMSGMAVHDNRLFVALERRDRDYYWQPVSPAYIAVIDLDRNELIDMDPSTAGMQGIELAASPYGRILTDPLSDDLLVLEVGSYGENDGGIERIDPATGQSRGWVIAESTLGGDLNVWTTAEGVQGFAVVIAGDWSTRVVGFDVLSGEPRGIVTSTNEYAYTHLLVDPARRQLFVCDRSYAHPGLRVFSTVDYQPLSPGPILGCLYPYWLLLMHGPDSGVNDSLSGGALALEVSPQPAVEDLRFDWLSGQDPARSLEIFEPSGRLRARLAVSGNSDNLRLTVAGLRLAAGAYVARLSTGSGGVTRLFRVVR